MNSPQRKAAAFFAILSWMATVGYAFGVPPATPERSVPDGHHAFAPTSGVESRPTLFLIGDSTVKNGRGDGAGGLWGWGQVIAEHFDQTRIHVDNRALGGRSSRTYLTEQLWERLLADLKPGDFVLMQFGHNDGGRLFEGDRPRASLKGNGDKTRDGVVAMTGNAETVHTYGWYLGRYIGDARARGATPIVLSPVPRNIWRNGRVARANRDYGKWAARAARDGGAAFIDLNDIVAGRYEAAGELTVRRNYFTSIDHTHTTDAGARVNAACVVEGIRHLENSPLKRFLRPAATRPADPDSAAAGFRFDFGSGAVSPGRIQVLPSTMYSDELGYGFEPGPRITSVECDQADSPGRGFCASDEPFFFSVAVPEGNYRVTATLGAPAVDNTITIRAELRRLMVENLRIRADTLATGTFAVNVRTPQLPDGKSVRLKDREQSTEARAWDNKLTLEFNGPRPCLAALDVRQDPTAVTVYLAGDSTVADQPLEPWNSWGQMLPRFFQPGVAIANHSESGESIRSSLGARRFDKIFSLIKPGDYLFVQFGHNDMKDQSPDALATYRANLERLVDETRRHGARPVLVTSMERKEGVDRDTLGEYPQIVRDVAKQKGVALVDLHAMSKVLYRALGDDLGAAFQDGTHHNNYGSYELAKCVVRGTRECDLPLAKFIADDVALFDPARPDPIGDFTVPVGRH